MGLLSWIINAEHTLERALGLHPPPDVAGDGSPMASPTSPAQPTIPAGLADVRRHVLEAVAEVVPSAYPSPRWHALAPTYDPAHLPVPHYSTCGELPRYVGARVGINTRGGLSSIRDLGEKVGAWVVGAPGKTPKPGDFLLLGDGRGAVLHTGVFVSDPGDGAGNWITGDAGQGGHTAENPQRAAYVTRHYDPAANTLSGLSGPRVVLGWLDVEAAAAAAGSRGIA